MKNYERDKEAGDKTTNKRLKIDRNDRSSIQRL